MFDTIDSIDSDQSIMSTTDVLTTLSSCNKMKVILKWARGKGSYSIPHKILQNCAEDTVGLQTVAKPYMTNPARSTESEKMFSKAAKVISTKRTFVTDGYCF